MDIPTPEEIVAAIEAFLERQGMSQSRFGSEATRNANIVADLRKGHQPSIAVLRRLSVFMAQKDAELSGGDHAQCDTAAEARHHG